MGATNRRSLLVGGGLGLGALGTWKNGHTRTRAHAHTLPGRGRAQGELFLLAIAGVGSYQATCYKLCMGRRDGIHTHDWLAHESRCR